jgi:hypothetical protein
VQRFPIGALKHYRLAKVYWLDPDSEVENPETDDFDLVLSVNPAGVDNKYELRQDLNSYFAEITTIVDSYLHEFEKNN